MEFGLNSVCSRVDVLGERCCYFAVLDLFSKAIVQSGSPLSFWAAHNDSADLEAYARRLAAHLSCNRPRIEDLVTCLQEIEWPTLMDAVCAVRSIVYVIIITSSSSSSSNIYTRYLIKQKVIEASCCRQTKCFFSAFLTVQ